MQASHLNTYYLVTFVSFFKSKKTQRMRKKWVVKGKLIKILHHCSLPQTSRLDSSNPAQANVSKSIANLSCRAQPTAHYTGQCYLLALGCLLCPSLSSSSSSSSTTTSCSRIVFHTNTPPHSTTCSHSLSPGDGSSRVRSQPASAPKLDVTVKMSKLYKCTGPCLFPQTEV